MAIKNIICRGIGFSPGSVSYIPTLGFSIGEVVVPVDPWINMSSISSSWAVGGGVSSNWKPVSQTGGDWR